MKIYAKLSLISLTLTVAPLLIVLAFFYRYSNDSIKSEIFSKLEVITKLKADKLEKFFENCRSDLTNNRSHISARTYLPVLARLVGARDNVAYVEAKRIMDTQLNIFLESHPHFSDIILLDVRGQIVYTANPDHTSLIGRRLPGPDPEAFEKAKAGIYVGQIFSSEDKKYPYGMLLAAPVYDNQNQFCGVVAHLLDAEAIYRITQDKTGLEHSGETLLVRRLSDAAVLFISPLRYEPNAVLHKQIPIGGPHGIAAQRAVQGKNGIGRSSDYRGVDTLSCWRYLPGLGWGLVAKIDADEALDPIRRSGHVMTVILAVVMGVVLLTVVSVARSICDPIRRLQRGAEVIGSGNFDCKVGTSGDDEISQLSRAFDRMTKNLHKTTASKKELELEIAERKEAQTQILRLSQAVEQASSSIVITDLEGKIIYANPFFTQTTGYTFRESIGQNPRILKTGEQPVEYYKTLWDTITAGNTWRGEFHNKKKGGEFYWESATIAPVKNEEGEIINFIAVKEDITERKRIEKELERAMRIKMEFMSMVSHELRTPLTAIKESVGIVLDGSAGTLNAEQADFLDTAGRNLTRLGRLIDNVLDYQKLDSDCIALRRVRADINKVVEEAAKGFDLVARAKGLDLVLNLGGGLPNISLDRDKIVQVLINLLNNAIKFSQKGCIAVRSELAGNTICVSVQDPGPGIRAEDTAKLFNSFSQVPDAAHQKPGGTGLGLAISKKIIELHHGKIGVETIYGSGSKFYFLLPISERRQTTPSER